MPQPVSSFFSDVTDWFKNLLSEEPAALVGTVASLLTFAASQLNLAGVHSWQALVPVVLAAVIRQFVVSPATHSRATNAVAEVVRQVIAAPVEPAPPTPPAPPVTPA